MDIITKAQRKTIDQFERHLERRRVDDKVTVHLRDNSPSWMLDAIRDAHDGTLPNDLIWEHVAGIIACLGDDDLTWAEAEDSTTEPDVYYSDQIKWIAEIPAALIYCDEARAEGLVQEDADMSIRIMMGQYVQLRMIFSTLRQAIEDNSEEE